MMDAIRIGIVGAGANTRLHHIPGFQALPNVEVVSVCNRTRESGERVAEEFGIPEVYDDWEELVEAEDTDAICIGTWPYLHCPVTLAALDEGKHVLTEARMAMNSGRSPRNAVGVFGELAAGDANCAGSDDAEVRSDDFGPYRGWVSWGRFWRWTCWVTEGHSSIGTVRFTGGRKGT